MSQPASTAPLRGMWVRMLARLRPHWVVTAGVLVAALAEAAFDILFPLSIKYLIDEATVSGDRARFGQLLVALAAIFLLGVIGGVGRDRLSPVLSSRVLRDIRAQLFAHLQRLSNDFYARRESGDLAARFSGDLVAVETAYSRTLALTVNGAAGVLAGIPLLIALDWRLFALTMLVLPASFIGPRLFGGPASQAGYAAREAEGHAVSVAQEGIAGHPVIRAFGWQAVSQARFEDALGALARAHARAGFLIRLVSRTSYIASTLAQVVIVGAGAALVLAGEMTIGSLVGFVGLLISVGGAVGSLANAVPEWLQAGVGMRRIEEILHERPAVQDAPDARELRSFEREIRFEDVGFGYSRDRLTVRGVGLTIRAGQRVAVVGRSGSGKSTLFNLITRFYDPAEGAVKIDGHDLRAVTQGSLRRQMSVVFQDSFLFTGSIADNIRVGKPDASDAEVEAAARAAQVHDLVAGWPEGYATEVGERGGQLSGGQRQRIALARALVRKPAILLLDEATSALDPATEAAFNETLAAVATGRTVVSVTHRLSSAVAADHIFVMDEGRLVEQGSHDALIDLGGVYAEMWQRQREGVAISADGRRAAITPAGLRAMPLFATLAESGLAQIAERFTSERLPPDRVVFAQGDVGDRFYVLAHGSAAVTQHAPDGGERRLRVLQDGDVFGELALLNDAPRSATIRTLSPCLLLVLSADSFTHLLETVSGLRAAVESVAQGRVDAPEAGKRIQ